MTVAMHGCRTTTRRPIVGIPTQTLQASAASRPDIPPSWVMSQRYVLTLTNAGAIPWLIPLVDDDDAARSLRRARRRVSARRRRHRSRCRTARRPHPLCDKTDRERDRVELALARWAMEDGKPVLGVCRGMQLINLAAGGTLYQDLAEQMPGSIKHDYFPFGGQSYTRDYLAHEVNVAPGTPSRRRVRRRRRCA